MDGKPTVPGSTIDSRGQLHVAVVEDDPTMVQLVTLALESDEAVSVRYFGADAAALMDERVWEGVDVALIDLFLPGTKGDDLLLWLASRVPHVRRVAMSAAGPLRLAQSPEVDACLLKPFLLDELSEAIGSGAPSGAARRPTLVPDSMP